MKRQLAVLVLGLVVVLVAAGELAHAAAGPGANDIQDSRPAFSSNGVDIAFTRGAARQTSRVLDMAADGKSLHGVTDGVLRGWVPGTENLLVQVDSVHTVVVADNGRGPDRGGVVGVEANPSPDGTRLAYLRDGTLYVSAIDGSGERPVATGVTPPSWDIAGAVWSPDGTRIAVATGSSLRVVQSDGSGSRLLYAGTNQEVNPSWSPDGATIAFESNDGPTWTIWLIGSDGSSPHQLSHQLAGDGRFPQFDPANPRYLAYISDRQGVKGGATPYQYALYVSDLGEGTAPEKLVDDVHPYSPAAWSPTGALLAVSAGQECRRWGIYVMRPGPGFQAHRRSNLCRVDGTARADHLGGTPYFDIVNGNGGNDIIQGNAGDDKLSGENGNDTIYGDAGNDFILAGPGDDRVYGGTGNDTIIGGNGHDRIDCGPGVDRVEGAGPLDIVAKNCEHVSR